MLNEKVMKEFQEFGSRMSIIAILSILSFVLPFVGIIELIFIFMALGNIKRICFESPNMNLMEFRSKYIIAFVISLLGGFFLFGAMIFLVIFVIYGYYWSYFILITFGVLMLIGIIIFVISGYIEYKAWENLMIYFETNKTMFPEIIAIEAIKGSKNLKLGAIFNLTIILAIVGVILRIIGFFQLASLKKLYEARGQPYIAPPTAVQPRISQPQAIAQEPAVSSTAGKFCPYCGTQVRADTKFCASCGAKI